LNILAIDTSSVYGSVALYNEKISFIGFSDIRVTHSERLLPQIDTALKQSKLNIKDLDAVCLSNGPGSFTGIRIGLSTAKAICMGNQIPLIAYNSLEVLAANLYGNKLPILALNDAKMSEIYGALYTHELKEMIPPQNAKPQEFLKNINEPVCIVGDGYLAYKEIIEQSEIQYTIPLLHQNIPLASSMISMILFDDELPKYDFDYISDLEPFYLRKSQAELVRDLKLQKK
jgi:tRNA threonylcarbamoyladenosine biosynthesis protein TsaB